MERSEPDPATGRWLSKNLSGVHIPVNADIPADITVNFVDEWDEHASIIGAKGMGELGATGFDAAVADAVFDAVGVRYAARGDQLVENRGQAGARPVVTSAGTVPTACAQANCHLNSDAIDTIRMFRAIRHIFIRLGFYSRTTTTVV